MHGGVDAHLFAASPSVEKFGARIPRWHPTGPIRIRTQHHYDTAQLDSAPIDHSRSEGMNEEGRRVIEHTLSAQ